MSVSSPSVQWYTWKSSRRLGIRLIILEVLTTDLTALHITRRPTLAFSGAANGIPRLMRIARRGLRCNALLDGSPSQSVLARGTGHEPHDGVSQNHNADVGRRVCQKRRRPRTEDHPLWEHRGVQVIPRWAHHRYNCNEHG